MLHIEQDDPARLDVRTLLNEHLADMRATSPADSVHALDHAALSGPEITFWTAREDGALLGCGALKRLSKNQAEVKSMRTTPAARGRGIAALLLNQIVDHARRLNYELLSLETGSQEFFAPARRLYRRHGFHDCPPFASYSLDPNSAFMQLSLVSGTPELSL